MTTTTGTSEPAEPATDSAVSLPEAADGHPATLQAPLHDPTRSSSATGAPRPEEAFVTTVRPGSSLSADDLTDFGAVLSALRDPGSTSRARSDLLRLAADWIDPSSAAPEARGPLRTGGDALARLVSRNAGPMSYGELSPALVDVGDGSPGTGADGAVAGSSHPGQVETTRSGTALRPLPPAASATSAVGATSAGGTRATAADEPPSDDADVVDVQMSAAVAAASRGEVLREAARRLAGHPARSRGLVPAASPALRAPDLADPEILASWIGLVLLAFPVDVAQHEHDCLAARMAGHGHAPVPSADSLGLGAPLQEAVDALGTKAERFGALAVAVSDLLRISELDDPAELVRCAWERGPDRPLCDPDVRARYREEALRRLRRLANAEPEQSEAEAEEVWRVHEMVASVYPWPLPAKDSWWDRALTAARRALDQAGTEIAAGPRPAIGAVPVNTTERTQPDRYRDDDIEIIDRQHPGWLLRELRAPYLGSSGRFESQGRALRTTSR
ncbi:hypothetical protein ACG83_31170 [Frankia sp. R43]|uniref:hypothetical protein n=1 Tax=Frankia sp. R43 TaxID=269536 RepID=UPI0006CA4480|nr:hypothetical protein [Frankia sp. R43]KPM52019.1 hypothetical protein ACG83_31170 [Frankia sp. R43]